MLHLLFLQVKKMHKTCTNTDILVSESYVVIALCWFIVSQWYIERCNPNSYSQWSTLGLLSVRELQESTDLPYGVFMTMILATSGQTKDVESF